MASEGEGHLGRYLAESRDLVIDQIRALVPTGRRRSRTLYDRMLDYPLREAKALRPALCIAVCRALGGPVEAVLPSAAALELYHNAFLIHDDVEDGSWMRRGRPTLHRMFGVPVAVNIGDAMLALALEPLLENTAHLGLGKALRILQVVARMARESAEGQATELDWIREARWDLRDDEYVRMVYQKTCWYTFIAPVLIGGIAADADPARLRTLQRFATLLGVAFQIRDDALNLEADEEVYGKEILGDLWEGKRTLILMDTLRRADAADRARATDILGWTRQDKSAADVRFLFGLVRQHDSIAYAGCAARRRATRAGRILADMADRMGPSVHLDFLNELTRYVVGRGR